MAGHLFKQSSNRVCLQLESINTKRIFSAASRIIIAKRNHLGTEMAGKSLFVSQNWHWCESQIKMEEVLADNV